MTIITYLVSFWPYIEIFDRKVRANQMGQDQVSFTSITTTLFIPDSRTRFLLTVQGLIYGHHVTVNVAIQSSSRFVY